MEVKIEGEEQPETPGLEEMIDLSSFTDGIYICEVKYFLPFTANILMSVKYFRFARRTRRRTTTWLPTG